MQKHSTCKEWKRGSVESVEAGTTRVTNAPQLGYGEKGRS